MQAKVKRGTAQQPSVELQITFHLLDAFCCFFIFFFFFWISVYLFVFNGNGSRRYLPWTHCQVSARHTGSPGKGRLTARAVLGDHSTQLELVQNSSSGHSGITFKNILKLFHALPF